jgi:hypothetical protein
MTSPAAVPRFDVSLDVLIMGAGPTDIRAMRLQADAPFTTSAVVHVSVRRDRTLPG